MIQLVGELFKFADGGDDGAAARVFAGCKVVSHAERAIDVHAIGHPAADRASGDVVAASNGFIIRWPTATAESRKHGFYLWIVGGHGDKQRIVSNSVTFNGRLIVNVLKQLITMRLDDFLHPCAWQTFQFGGQGCGQAG